MVRPIIGGGNEIEEDQINYLQVAKEVVRLGNKVREVKGRFPTSFVGLAGEFLAMHRLAERGVRFSPKGAQAAYDIELNGGKMEVRTSQSKDERVLPRRKGVVTWGWRLKDRGRDVKFDYVICVALDGFQIEDSMCYLLTRDEVDKAPRVKLPRFKAVEKKLSIYASLEEMEETRRYKPKYVPEWEAEINRNKIKYLLENRVNALPERL